MEKRNVLPWLVLVVCSFVLSACGDDGGADAGRPDSSTSPEPDAGGGEIVCSADRAGAAATAGCNGGFVANPARNQPNGRCMPGGDDEPRGSCTTEGAVCMGDLAGSDEGWCVIICAAPESYVDGEGCPSGQRCFRMGEGDDAFGICFHDCNEENPCQEGWSCNAEGRCEEMEPT